MRNTKLKYIITIFLSIFLTEAGISQTFVSLSSPSKPGTLIINHINGSINVLGYDGEVVIIELSAGETKNASGERETGDPDLITTHEENNEITVHSVSPWKTLDYSIKVPKKFSLKLNTRDKGKITVRNVTGEFEINNLNGDIELNDISGSAVLSTIDGKISVRFLDVSPDVPMAFTSIEGSIDVTFPPEIKARLKMKYGGGSLYTDFEMSIEKLMSGSDKNPESGLNRLTFDDWTYGLLNGGGPEIILKSLNGSLYIRKRN